ncbi:hypothetical protein HDF16_004840 [Granulicella aggregans]|uniref:Uncharacterized protein n=1 Tax=Granulicella aggregans TaxID=474949 RepID=A0A7W7ZIE4_9BACT|nr:hypothetical protein [Granulicella aggregans]MBB5060104.1 hypothetical protein [Granulicella aggregans]
MKFAVYWPFWALCSRALVLANGPFAYGQQMIVAASPLRLST